MNRFSLVIALSACAGCSISAPAGTLPVMTYNFLGGLNSSLVSGWGWDRSPAGGIADLAITSGASLSNPLVPTETAFPLSLGVNRFVGFASWDSPLSGASVFWSVFLNGANSPQIVAATSASLDPALPAMFGGGSYQTYTSSGAIEPISPRSTIAIVGEYSVELSSLIVTQPSTIPADRMSNFAQGADGYADWVVQFALTVQVIPSPGPVGLLGLSLAAFARRQRS